MSCMPRQQRRFGSQVASAETPSEISRTRAHGRSDIGLSDGRTDADGARAREAQLDSNENEQEEE